ncbi:hypothetical protein L0F13_25355, partial [Klebsiella pneumoniae]|nr:hypothetical protein [Klebsiella pneumoniae]
FTGQIMINHSQFCFRGILWFSHKIAPYSVGCPTFGVQSKRRRRAMASGTELLLCRVAAAPYPAYNPKSPLALGLLKLPVLAASTSLRRSRKAGAARMDAG